MFYAYLDFWRRAFDFAGRSDRPDYWWAIFANMLITILSLIFLLTVGEDAAPLLSLIQIYGFFTIIPNLSLSIRRLRDAGYHWAFIFVSFIPVIGNFILLFFLCQPSEY